MGPAQSVSSFTGLPFHIPGAYTAHEMTQHLPHTYPMMVTPLLPPLWKGWSCWEQGDGAGWRCVEG